MDEKTWEEQFYGSLMRLRVRWASNGAATITILLADEERDCVLNAPQMRELGEAIMAHFPQSISTNPQ